MTLRMWIKTCGCTMFSHSLLLVIFSHSFFDLFYFHFFSIPLSRRVGLVWHVFFLQLAKVCEPDGHLLLCKVQWFVLIPLALLHSSTVPSHLFFFFFLIHSFSHTHVHILISGMWGDQRCLNDLQYICKRTNTSVVKPPVPPPPSVQYGGCPRGWIPFVNKVSSRTAFCCWHVEYAHWEGREYYPVLKLHVW